MTFFVHPAVVKYAEKSYRLNKKRYIAERDQDFLLNMDACSISLRLAPNSAKDGGLCFYDWYPRSDEAGPTVISVENVPEILGTKYPRMKAWKERGLLGDTFLLMIVLTLETLAARDKAFWENIVTHMFMFDATPNTTFFEFLFSEVMLTKMTSHFMTTTCDILNNKKASNQNDNLLVLAEVCNHEDPFVRHAFEPLKYPGVGRFPNRLLDNNDLSDNVKVRNLAFLVVSLCCFTDTMAFQSTIPNNDDLSDMLRHCANLWVIPNLILQVQFLKNVWVMKVLHNLIMPDLFHRVGLDDNATHELILFGLYYSFLAVTVIEYLVRAALDGNVPRTWFHLGARTYGAVLLISWNPLVILADAVGKCLLSKRKNINSNL